jgi:hypothetical protein
MKDTNRYTHILKNDIEKYGFNIIDSGDILYFSDYIYDEVYPLNTHIQSYLECDLIKLKNNGLYGIFDAWKITNVLQLEYKNIEVFHFYGNFCYLCQLQNDKYILKLKNEQNNTQYDKIMYIGEFKNKYLFMGQIDNNISVFELYSNNIIINENKYLFEFYGTTNFIVLKLVKENISDPDLYDIYSTSGVLLYEGMSDYYFLNIS